MALSDDATAKLELDALQREALKEVANIGAGHAATALSQMLNSSIGITTPTIDVVPFHQLDEHTGIGTDAVAMLHMQVRGDAPAQMIVLFDRDDAFNFVNAFLTRIIGDIRVFDAIVESTLKEMGSIIAGSYLTALIELTGVDLLPSVPTLSYGTIGAALDRLAIVPDQDVFLISCGFLENGAAVSGKFILIPEAGSLNALLSVFGLG